MKKTVVIALLALSTLFAHGQPIYNLFGFKNVKGYNGKGNDKPNGFTALVVDYSLPMNFPLTVISVLNNNTNGDEIVAMYFQGLPTTQYFDSEAVGGSLYEWLDAPTFSFSKQLEFNPDQVWTGTPITNGSANDWFYETDIYQVPFYPSIEAGVMRIGLMVRSVDGRVSFYLNEFTATVQ